MSLQTPRILPSHLNAFHPSSAGQRSTHTIRILGTVSALRGDTATITCGNNGDVTLILKPDSHLQMGKMIEVVGKVADLDGGQVCLYWYTCGEERSLELNPLPWTRELVEYQYFHGYLTEWTRAGPWCSSIGNYGLGQPRGIRWEFFLRKHHETELFSNNWLIFPIDYRTYEQVVEATHRFKSIFYDAE